MVRAAMKLTSTVKKSNGPAAVVSGSVFQCTPVEVGHARVVAQRRVQLSAADVDGGDVRGAVRQERLGEAAGRTRRCRWPCAADARPEAEALDGRFELETAAPDPAPALALH